MTPTFRGAWIAGAMTLVACSSSTQSSTSTSGTSSSASSSTSGMSATTTSGSGSTTSSSIGSTSGTSGGQPTHILVFGGSDGSDAGVLGDTWTWDGTSWTQHNVPGPAPRSSAVAGAFDGKVVLYGGVVLLADGGTALGSDTWIWDGTGWTQANVTGPSARELAQGGTYNGTFVLFGGYNAGADGTNDVWTWDGGEWTQNVPDTDPVEGLNGSPTTEIGLASTTYQSSVLFTSGASIWEWNGAWTYVDGGTPGASSPGGGSQLQSATAATVGNDVVLFGGIDFGSFTPNPGSQTWTWDGATWTNVATANAPSPRVSQGMATLNGEAVLFGGWAFTDGGTIVDGAGILFAYMGDTWTWDGGAWTPLAVTGPSPRLGMVMVAY